ncbi:MAG: hypothetical protein A3B23_03185 [Candidatus Colwellbacteria bacterium RIFCSPLOWO2_01_FULL_48_10]|uniref:Response regulatory domain-containing protein n=2 Tax=Bacteria candidate phyla TaxID=1783234 RepID=A0A1F5NZA9_9BACT|nr:MAG: hypothetical protein A2846_02415 [Candidatus Doudnabacteria bacterium RIFCSPHIGHO2_01_FULL_49_9]OGY59655.1 MAG: hypothetical protein A3B23_03185 [Candidatus Colwellbacteria bacterium RIFCSPLOWO2_01_FULL_48_10]
MKIVIVEDEVTLSKALQEKFKRSGLETHVAHDGVEALEMIKKTLPDIIALDVLIPKKNGFKVLEAIKSDPNLKDIPVFILSNLGQDEDIKTALRLGAEDYLVKAQHPINEIVEKFKMRLLKKSK